MPGRRGRFLSACVLSVVSILAPRPSFAGEEESKTFFAQGRELRLQGRCVDAVVAFKKAFDTHPQGLGALRNIAECEEQLSRFASARRSYWDLRVAVLKSPEEKYDGWDKEAEAGFARLAPRVPKVVIRVRGPADPKVRVNGRPLDKTLLGSEIEQDVGDLEVILEDGSAAPPTKKLRVEEGKVYEVDLEGAAGTAPKTTLTPGEEDAGGVSPLIVVGGVSFGVAGLSLGGMIGAIVVRSSALDAIEGPCPTLTGCDPALQGDLDRGETASLLVNVFAVSTGVFGALGIALVTADALAPADAPADATAVELMPVFSESGGFVSVRGRFF